MLAAVASIVDILNLKTFDERRIVSCIIKKVKFYFLENQKTF